MPKGMTAEMRSWDKPEEAGSGVQVLGLVLQRSKFALFLK